MTIHVDYACRKNCWNLIDSYSCMHCVGCGCCVSDRKARYENRIRVLERWLKEWHAFNDWQEGFEDIQRKNQKENIKSFSRMLRYYKEKLEKLS